MRGEIFQLWMTLTTGSKKKRGRIHTWSNSQKTLLLNYLDEVEIIDWGPACAILPKVNIDKVFSELVNAHPKLDVYKKGGLPMELNYNNHRRIQPIIAIAKEHWSISDRNTYNRDPYIYLSLIHI